MRGSMQINAYSLTNREATSSENENWQMKHNFFNQQWPGLSMRVACGLLLLKSNDTIKFVGLFLLPTASRQNGIFEVEVKVKLSKVSILSF